MTLQRDVVLTAFLLVSTVGALEACGSRGGSSSPSPATPSSGNPSSGGGVSGGTSNTVGENVMTVTVDGSLCGGTQTQNVNQPCVEVSICVPGTGTCQTVSNLLLDTGSSGLRVFSSVITLSLPAVDSLAECVTFADNSSEWGPVLYADIKLASEPAVKVPMMSIDSTYASPPALCSAGQSTPDTGPSTQGFNGILGVGLFDQDCGAGCASDASNGQYFSCSGSNCTNATASLSQQVANPVGALPYDNNGVIMKLPSVGAGGQASASGTLVLGIGTQSNNTPSGVTLYNADADGNFTTTFSAYSSTALTSFIDSGTNFLAFPAISSLPDCSTTGAADASSLSGLFCPSSTLTLTAVNHSASGGKEGTVTFEIGNAATLSATSTNYVFNDIGASSGSGSSAFFDWGLPFFFGKDVYVGMDGKSSSLGSGMYWAY